MPYNYRFFFLSLSIFSSSLIAENTPINIKLLDEQDIPEIIRNILNNQQHHHHHEHHHHHYPQQEQSDQPIKEQPAFTEMEIEEMNLVFNSSPKEAQFIINHLQDPTFLNLTQDYRSKVFVGEPGSGKTVMARAIAYKMAQQGWEYKFLSSTSLLGENRNQTAIRFQKELDEIAASNKRTILIIDEANRLLEHTESKNHDTDSTATALWTFLDKQKGNTDFFFIGTMNRINKLPQPYKSRILFDCIKFLPITDLKVKNELIRNNLKRKNAKLDDEETEAFLNEKLEKIGPCVGRDLNGLSDQIYATSKINGPISSPMVIKKATITYVMDQYIKNKIELDYDYREETDEERQNRHHKENLAMQQSLFVQQQMIQLTTNEHQVSRQIPLSPWSINYLSPEGKKKIDLLISDEQKELLEEMMKETNAKRAAEEKAAAEEAKKWPWERKAK